jgi:hypothetical protein
MNSAKIFTNVIHMIYLVQINEMSGMKPEFLYERGCLT